MPKFKVLGTYDVEWLVEADTADEACDLIDAGETGDGQPTGYGFTKVVGASGDYDDEDLRAMCARKGCGHLVSDHWGPSGDGRPKTACVDYWCDCLSPVTPEAGEPE